MSIQELITCGRQWAQDYRAVPNARYLSWEHCYKVFAPHIGKSPTDKDADFLALHLGFYLASWGMYRASSFLFYTVRHLNNIDIEISKTERN